MLISKIFKGIATTIIGEDKDITKLEHNSKEVTKGSLFFCVDGTKTCGVSYVGEAIENGCEAVCVGKNDFEKIEKFEGVNNISIVLVDNVREVLGYACYNYFGASQFDFKLIGITGTNGKTTISFMLAHILKECGCSVGVIGTSGIFINGDMIRGEGLTTPDPIDMYDILSFFYSVDVEYVITEVSAHALDLKKLNGLTFDYGIFTNLTEDHLDYFKSMEAYGSAKARFFERVKIGVFNMDDDFGRKLCDDFALNKYTIGKDYADYIYQYTEGGCNIKYREEKVNLNYKLNGEYNAFNATCAYCVACDILKDKCRVKRAFDSLPLIAGRYNIFESENHAKIILDFAHTPDGLEKILKSAKVDVKLGGKLISVFGCGGNRDREKRAKMGEISGKLADYTIISIDNPRFEDPAQVMGDIEKGIKSVTNNYNIIMPRENAIRHAYLKTSQKDVIVISGKGMEPYYEENGYKHMYREDIVIKTIIKRYDRGESK